ncbi:MAG: hypothetical protein GC164_16025 [Phycisphaera sp.]|nr:hypothetical protein [Phycisphaera sp.]
MGRAASWLTVCVFAAATVMMGLWFLSTVVLDHPYEQWVRPVMVMGGTVTALGAPWCLAAALAPVKRQP